MLEDWNRTHTQRSPCQKSTQHNIDISVVALLMGGASDTDAEAKDRLK